ncbi:hypothetical protein ABIA35_006195 [Catenulispora sp. MAP12-49]|uniref:hypothetical protein n=1 Tax=Catenulispora sp. MAP12-49 TaxID=3156302 RepID=UPI003516C46A
MTVARPRSAGPAWQTRIDLRYAKWVMLWRVRRLPSRSRSTSDAVDTGEGVEYFRLFSIAEQRYGIYDHCP